MDSTTGTSLYPSHRCKTIHLVRHAQGIHNVAGEKDYDAYKSYDYFDAQLTPLGWQQVDNLHKHVHVTGLFKRIELVITSPLLRTMQTAVGVFGGEGYADGIDAPPLMVEKAGNSDHPAISSLNCPPFIAFELCREHLGVHPCDKRRSISEYQTLFPAIDFSLIEADEDILWTADTRETNEHVAKRGMEFMNWLWTRKEKEIAVVTHSGFLYHTLSAFGNDWHPSIKSEICKHFANCELRSMVIVDRSMLGSDSATTNFPGNIPSGLDLPSDVAAEKRLAKIWKPYKACGRQFILRNGYLTATAQFLYSPNHCRFLHLVRHRQGMHNLEAEKSLEALLSPKLFDTPISPLGWQQVADLRKYVLASGLLKQD